MQSLRVLSGVAMLAAFILGVVAPAAAQSFDPTLTDPGEIAQECGGDAAAGAPHFARLCAECHSLTAENASRRGPHLAELYGRQAGGVAGFAYSSALVGQAGIWEGSSLHLLLSGAMAVPGHPVLPDEQMRRDLLTYLRTETRPAPPAPEEVIVPVEVLAIVGDAAWGAYLAGDCLSCHNAASVGSGAAPIGGWEPERFVRVMHQYRARALANEAMQMQAMRLSDEEIAALAAYFAERKDDLGG